MHVISDHQQKIQIQINHSHQQINTKTTSPMENLATREGIPPSPTPLPSLDPPPSPFLYKSLSKFYILWERICINPKYRVWPILTTTVILLLLLTFQYLRLLTWPPQWPRGRCPCRPYQGLTRAPGTETTSDSRKLQSLIIFAFIDRDYITYPSLITFRHNEPEFAPFSDHLVAALHSKASSRSLSPAVWRLKSPRLSKVLLEKYYKFH